MSTVTPTNSSLTDIHELQDIRDEILSDNGSLLPAPKTTTTPNIHCSDGFNRPLSSMNYDHSSSPSNTLLQSFSATDVPPSTLSTQRVVSHPSPLDAAAVGSPNSCGGHQPGSETSSTTTLLGRYWLPPQTMSVVPTAEHHRRLSAEFSGLTMTLSSDEPYDHRCTEVQSSTTTRLISSSLNSRQRHSPQVRVEVNGVVSYCRPSSSTSSGSPDEHQYSASVADSLRDQRYATAPRRVNKNGSSTASAAARSTNYPNGTCQPLQTYVSVGGKLLRTRSPNSSDQSDVNGEVGMVLPVSAARQWHVPQDGYRVPTATIHRTHHMPSRSFLQQAADPVPLPLIVSGSSQQGNELQVNGNYETLGTLSGNDPGCQHLVECTRISDGTGSPNTKPTLQSYCI